MGAGSDFEVFERENFQILLLGCRFNEGCTFLHHMEAIAGVPYRHWLELPRLVIDHDVGTTRPIAVRYYARKSEEWESDFDRMQKPLREAKRITEAAAPYGRSFLTSTRDLHAVAAEHLARDPFALVTKAPPR